VVKPRKGWRVDFRRGLFRAWLAGSAVWIIAWPVYVWNTCWTGGDPKDPFVLCYTSLFSRGMREVGSFNLEDYLDFAFSPLAVPILALVGGLIVAWIMDVFKREKS
jgi:hypothetical protein